jgi:hypothetical protein
LENLDDDDGGDDDDDDDDDDGDLMMMMMTDALRCCAPGLFITRMSRSRVSVDTAWPACLLTSHNGHHHHRHHHAHDHSCLVQPAAAQYVMPGPGALELARVDARLLAKVFGG